MIDRSKFYFLDFGLAKNGGVKSESVTAEDTLNLPIRWSAPEVLSDIRSATTLSDVYSMGVLIWEISEFGTLPYLGLRYLLLKKFLFSHKLIVQRLPKKKYSKANI